VIGVVPVAAAVVARVVQAVADVDLAMGPAGSGANDAKVEAADSAVKDGEARHHAATASLSTSLPADKVIDVTTGADPEATGVIAADSAAEMTAIADRNMSHRQPLPD
jgi:hypothetical protein